MNTQLENLSKAWPGIKSIFSVPHSEQEYNKLVNILDQLIDEIGDDETHQLAPVMETIGKLIENYEDQHFALNKTAQQEVSYFTFRFNLAVLIQYSESARASVPSALSYQLMPGW